MIGYNLYVDNVLVLDTINGVNLGVTSGNFEVKLNDVGSLEFTLLGTYENISNLKLFKTFVRVEMVYLRYESGNTYRDNWRAFFGRVISIKDDIYGNKTFTCEDAFGFLKDCYVLVSNKDVWQTGVTINQLLTWCVSSWNSSYTNASNNGYMWLRTNSEGDLYIWGYDGAGQDSESDESYYSYLGLQYEKAYDAIKTHIFDTSGGALYFSYNQGTSSGREYTYINMAYYNTVDSSLSYNQFDDPVKDTGSDISIVFDEDDESTRPEKPSFNFTDNILSLSKSDIKNEIWTGLLVVGKDGMTISGVKYNFSSTSIYWDSSAVEKYGKIVKVVEQSELETASDCESYAMSYVSQFSPMRFDGMHNYTITAIEPCESIANCHYLTRLGYYAYVQVSDTLLVRYPCLSIKHDFFDIQSSEYCFGPIIPGNVLNETISANGSW